MLTFGPKHELFLADESAQIDLEGARYSGKSWVCCAKVLRSAKAHPGMRWLACRYSNEESQKIKTVLQYEIAPRLGIEVQWSSDQKAFTIPTVGLDSQIFCHGLKSQSRPEELAKVRGLDVGGLYNDQTEEVPQPIAEELPFATRQEGYPHQVILSPNPPTEDHFLSDMFPDECAYDIATTERIFPHRAYYRLSLYDNPHCPKDKLAELEATFPPTHAKYKSLILGLRGPNVVGRPVYDDVFLRSEHLRSLEWRDGQILLEAIDAGKHHPVWVAARRTAMGGLEVLGGLMGKRMFLEDFLPVVQRYRMEWFDGETKLQTCCDPPATQDVDAMASRFTNINTLRDSGLKPRWKVNANAPDVREAVIQHLASLMRRRGMFTLNADPERWLMVSPVVTKHTKLMVDALEGSYVWDEHFVSVGNKQVRQPKTDQWLDGWMRCLENLTLNFCAGQLSDDEQARRRRGGVGDEAVADARYSSPNAWMY